MQQEAPLLRRTASPHCRSRLRPPSLAGDARAEAMLSSPAALTGGDSIRRWSVCFFNAVRTFEELGSDSDRIRL